MKTKRILAFVCMTMMMLCLAFGCSAERSAGVLYRVEGGRNTMYLLGSIHIGSEEMYPMNEKLLAAIQQADTLVFECDTESADSIVATMEMMYYPTGETLRENISPETYALLEQVAQQSGYSMGMLNALKPWAVMSMLSVETTSAALGETDLARAMELGVEKQVQAAAGEKHIAYLESTRSQLEMMDGFSPELQEYMLSTACESILHPESATGLDASMELWPQWWRTGDDAAFAQVYLESMQMDPQPVLMQEYHEALVTRRNQGMARVLAEMLESPEKHSYFVTVGLLHLALPGDSVVSELQYMGYTVEKIDP